MFLKIFVKIFVHNEIYMRHCYLFTAYENALSYFLLNIKYGASQTHSCIVGGGSNSLASVLTIGVNPMTKSIGGLG